MKKKMMLALAVCLAAVMMTACGSKSGNTETTTAAGSSTEASKESGSKDAAGKESSSAADKETTKAVETTVDEKEAAGPGATAEDAVDEENKNFEDLENADYEGFAKQVVEAVKSKNMNALADLMAYPAYVSCVKDNDGIVNTRDELLAQDPEVIFDQELIDAVSKADLSNLEPLMTGIVIGEDTPNVIFNSIDGKLGITGINY